MNNMIPSNNQQINTKKHANWYCIVLLLSFSCIAILMIIYMTHSRREISSLRYELNNAIQQNEIDSRNCQIEKLDNEIAQYNELIESKRNNLAALEEAIAAESSKLEGLKFDNDLASNYEYALYDTENKRNDMTLDLLEFGSETMKSYGLDPDLLFGIIMVESEGHADAFNSYSGATGLGQIMANTGEFISTSFLGQSYDHSTTPYDPKTNIALIAAYLNYLNQTYDGDIMAMIKEYCGGDYDFAKQYYDKVIAAIGHDIDQ